MKRIFFSFLRLTFQKPLRFVLSLPKWEVSTGKKQFTPGKKSGNDQSLLPLKIFPLQRNKVMTHGEGPGKYVVHGPRTSSLRHWLSLCYDTVCMPIVVARGDRSASCVHYAVLQQRSRQL